MKFLICLASLLGGISTANAAEGMRLENRLAFRHPDLARPGACVMYREGGAGWIMTEPVFWLKGTTVSAELRKRKLARCPETPGKTIDRYDRQEFIRLAKNQPCVSRDDAVREEDIGVIRLRVDSWETPWSKRAANSGRLYQGNYLDLPLKQGIELEIDAEFVQACPAK